ncbi:hypothetical protein [Congregibacter litoralis]|uniref:Uncharacterized protein n=1 Tax=Congregibacter litoralis KT71 TaxID=314285 RepID=A4A773_9GAMM|nr:hypothetical protein [Congregibacter litoralis]EAQ98142.2 hypothetical protein KT71_02807 [Congregibacter litoralis KT71]
MKQPQANYGGASLGRQRFSRDYSLRFVLCLFAASLAAASARSQTEPYSYYGGEIETEAKNAAIEYCEYELLVEEQRCNRRANKSACIKEVHRECREKHEDPPEKDKPRDN